MQLYKVYTGREMMTFLELAKTIPDVYKNLTVEGWLALAASPERIDPMDTPKPILEGILINLIHMRRTLTKQDL